MIKKTFKAFFGFVLGIALGSCAQAIAFPYVYYNIKAESFRGTLESDLPENDISFEECAPSPGKLNKCTLMLTPTFTKMKSDYQKLAIDLKACKDSQN